MSCSAGTQLYRVWRDDGRPYVHVCAKDEAQAMKRGSTRTKKATKATLVLPSSHWQKERRLGNYPVRRKVRRRAASR